jgi:hypothetical protein
LSGNTSATGGYLPQVNTPLADQDLENAITALVAGVLQMSAALVRPRWQAIPPKQPSPTTNWAAVGITSRETADYPVIQHHAGGPDTLTRWSILHCAVSIYGPNASGLAEQLRDALYINQNFEALSAVGIKLMDAGNVTAVPDLFNTQWINRADIEIRLAQAVDRDYAVLDIASSHGIVTTDDDVTSEWNVSE